MKNTKDTFTVIKCIIMSKIENEEINNSTIYI